LTSFRLSRRPVVRNLLLSQLSAGGHNLGAFLRNRRRMMKHVAATTGSEAITPPDTKGATLLGGTGCVICGPFGALLQPLLHWQLVFGAAACCKPVYVSV